MSSSETRKQRSRPRKSPAARPSQSVNRSALSGFRSRSFFVAAAVFFATRAYILFYGDIQGSTLYEVNVSYTYCAQYAQAHGVSFYQTVRDLKAARNPRKDPIEYAVEYPPLAVGWMLLPGMFLPPIPDTPPSDLLRDYIQGNRVVMALADLAAFLLLAATLPLFVRRTESRYDWRLLSYAAAGLLLMHILYDRMDLVVGLLILAALRLLAGRGHYLWSFAVLAVAINFKLTPLVLAPIWVVGSLPAATFAGLHRNPGAWLRLTIEGAKRTAVLLALTAAMFLPFYVVSGRDTLAMFAYHSRRGLEIESTWAWLAMLAGRLLHIPTATVSSFGSLNVVSSITPMLTRIAPLATILLLLGAFAGLLPALEARFSRGNAGETTATAAQAAPDIFAAFTVVALLLSIATSGVLSPQYLLWLIPLAPLIAPEGRFANLFPGVFLVACLFTTLVFPYAWSQEFNHAADGNPLAYRSPGGLGLTLLSIRNLVLLGLTAGLARWSLREVRSTRGVTAVR